MLNSIGLQNIGIDKVIRDMAPDWERWRVPVIVSILGSSVDEYGACAEALEGVTGVAGLELNISSPNAQQGGMEFGQDARVAAQVTAACVRATTLPVIVKLTPNVTDITEIARATVDAGASALCVINTLQAMSIDAETRRPRIARTFAGLSGPAMKPVALRMVWQVCGAVGGARHRLWRHHVRHRCGGVPARRGHGRAGWDGDVPRPAGAHTRARWHRAVHARARRRRCPRADRRGAARWRGHRKGCPCVGEPPHPNLPMAPVRAPEPLLSVSPFLRVIGAAADDAQGKLRRG